eukprot:g40199.t1
MAEQEPTEEQLAAIAAENLDEESTVTYKAPAQKSLKEIEELDKDDESLRKYKEVLLGNRSKIVGVLLPCLVTSSVQPPGEKTHRCFIGDCTEDVTKHGWLAHRAGLLFRRCFVTVLGNILSAAFDEAL